jgi:hypothetical protein
MAPALDRLRDRALPFVTVDWANSAPLLVGLYAQIVLDLPTGVLLCDFDPASAVSPPTPLFLASNSESPVEPPPPSQLSSHARGPSPSPSPPAASAPSASAPPVSSHYGLRDHPRASTRALAAEASMPPAIPPRAANLRPEVEVDVGRGVPRRRESSAQLSAAATSTAPPAPPLITSRSADSAVGGRLARGQAVCLFSCVLVLWSGADYLPLS